MPFIAVIAFAMALCTSAIDDHDHLSLLQHRAVALPAQQQTPVPDKISCYSKGGVYFWGGPAYSPSSGWSPCSSAYHADFYAFSTQQPGTVKITCYTSGGEYFYGGPDYTSSWSTCASQGIIGSDFYAFQTEYPKSVEITCHTNGGTYFYNGPGYTSSWSACSAGFDATWHAFQNPADYELETEVIVDGLDPEERETEIADEQENIHDCKNWCHGKKHKAKPWSKKCGWFACSGCAEC